MTNLNSNLDERKYWVALSANPKIGARTMIKLHKHFKKLSLVWKAKKSDLKMAGLEEGQIKNVQEAVLKNNPDREMEKVINHKIDVLIITDDFYPKLLKEIPDPPAILYIKGKIIPEDEISLAVVGSRKYTQYGKRVVEDLVYKLTKQKLTIVSGLALGIDALAHLATLDSGGRTIAVLGCGLDRIYPVANTRIAEKIIHNNGAIISEFPLGEIAQKYNFPIRNRIIAGMSLGTLIIEGADDSGSLITANAALSYDREVFAIPGSIYSETSSGPNRLIQMGAKLVIDENDILRELNITDISAQKEAQLIIPDSPEEEKILKLLSSEMTVDELIRKSNMVSGLVNSTLIMLEMKGMVTNLGGTRYVIRGKLK